MGEQLSWEEIKKLHPELAKRLRDGDMEARVEFMRLSFGAEIIGEFRRDGRDAPNGDPQRGSRSGTRNTGRR